MRLLPLPAVHRDGSAVISAKRSMAKEGSRTGVRNTTQRQMASTGGIRTIQNSPAPRPQVAAPNRTNQEDPYRLLQYRPAAKGQYPAAPMINVHLIPKYLTKIPDSAQVTTMRQKVRALAALTSQGLCWPPPPREFIAPHMPGAQKLQMPRIMALYKVDRYHFTFLRGRSCSDCVSTVTSAKFPYFSSAMLSRLWLVQGRIRQSNRAQHKREWDELQ